MEQTKQPTQVIKKVETPVHELVLSKVTALQESQSLNLPSDYSAVNALRGAYQIIQDMTDSKTGVPILQVVTRDSVINSLFNMVSQGLSPQKQQCAFIQYGKKLVMQRMFSGTIALAKRFGGLKEIHAQVIYEKDEIEFRIDPKTGRREVVKHSQQLENINPERIKGGYAVIILNDGTTDVEVMTMDQIKKAWAQGSNNENSKVRQNFPDQLVKKTVAARACKLLISTSNDSVLLDDSEDSPVHQSLPSMSADESPVEPAKEPELIDIPVAEVVPAQEPKSEDDKAPF